MAAQEPLRIHSRLTLPAKELQVSFARSGGPGGQNVNKVESKVVLRFSIEDSEVLGERRREVLRAELASRLTNEGEIVIHASRHRDQAGNLEDARERLAELLREALKPRVKRKETRPTRASVRRRLKDKKQRSDIKRQRRQGKRGEE